MVLMWIIAVVVSLVLLLVGFYKYYTKSTTYWPKRGVTLISQKDIATPTERWLMKVPIHFMDQRMYQSIRSKNLKYAGTQEFQKPTFFATDLDLIKHIMVKDFEYFVNRRVFEGQKKDKYFGEMMLLKENQEWKDLRSTMSPTFTTGKIRRMFEIFNESGTKFAKFIENELKESNELDLKDISGKYTLDVIASSAFGMDSKIFDSKESIFSVMGKRFQNNFSGFVGILKMMIFFLSPKLAQLLKIPLTDQEAADFFLETVRKAKKHRMETGEKREDFLQLMIEAQAGQLKAEPLDHENDQYEKDSKLAPEKTNKIKITDDIILAQCLLFFIAGFDTTETLLIFAAYELALNQEVQEKLYQEIQDSITENDGKLTYDTINRMEYLDKVISETLRKFPPGVRTERQATFDYKLPDSDIILEKGTVVGVPVFAIHHDPEYYPEPEKFDPERFSPESKAKRHPYAYMPFGVGPRNCIAMRFALIEGKTAIAKLVHNFILEPCSKTHIPMKYPRIGLMKPDGGMWLSVKSRNGRIEE